MDRRQFLTAGSLAVLFGVTGLSSVALADPPSWAPAHGRRRRDGTESEYTGKKNKNRSRDIDDIDREAALTRRERELARSAREDRLLRMEREDRILRRERELSRMDRENRLIERERRRPLQLGDLPRLFTD